MTNGDVLERYRAMLETPSVLTIDPSALLRDMAAEVERLRGPRVDMNEKAIEAAAKAFMHKACSAGPRCECAKGSDLWFSPSCAVIKAHAKMHAELSAALPPLRAREDIAQLSSKLMQIADGALDDPADEAVVRDAADALVRLSCTAGQEWRDEEIRAETFDFAAKIAFERDDDRTGEALKELASEIRKRVLPVPPVAEPKS